MTTPRRPRVWVDLHMDANLTAAAASLQDLLSAAVVDLQTKTVIRLIGRLRAIPSVVANNTVSAQLVSIGIGVTSREAFTAGGVSVPSPAVQTEFPTGGWLYKEQAVLVNQQDSGTVEAWEFPEFRFDIRASRKVDRGIFFVRVVNTDLLAGSTAIKVAGLVRCLVLN